MPDIARRLFLANISAAPAVIAAASLPMPVLAHAAAHADVALIAQAALVTRLARLNDKAHDRAARKSDAVMLARGPKPTAPDPWGGATIIEEHPVDPASDIERSFTVTMRKPPAGHEEAKRRAAVALAAWETESNRLERAAGAPDAGALCDALCDRLADAVDALIDMPATSPAGMAAKAGAFLALMETLDSADEQETELARSLARDAVRIGGAA